MAKRRPQIPKPTQTELLTQSRRRCCLCFGLNSDIEQKNGQIAHLDHNRFNNRLDNLAWLCLSHHDDYDSIRRQTKCLTAEEVKVYRSKLYDQLSKFPFAPSAVEEPIDYHEESDVALSVIYRYSEVDTTTSKVIGVEILIRVEKLYQFYRQEQAEHQIIESQNLSEADSETHYWLIRKKLLEQLGLPNGIYGLSPEEHPTKQWLRSARRLAKKWAAGELSYEQCKDVLWVFDTEFHLDPFYMLFGIPAEDMSKMQMRALTAFIFEHGQREYYPFLVEVTDDVPF